MVNSPILVTGIHRSGTTWVGNVLARAPGLAYIHEPFNIERRSGLNFAPVDYWYTYISPENNFRFYAPVKSIVNWHYSIKTEFSEGVFYRNLGRFCRDGFRYISYHYLFHPRPVIKDPFALFSAKWFAETFNAQILILIRHPAAVVSSMIRKKWEFPFGHWLDQENLLRDYLRPFKTVIEKYASDPPPIIDQAILLWKCVYYTVHLFQEQRPSWLFYRLEDIALDPISQFTHIFHQLNLQWIPSVENFILKSSDESNPVDPGNVNVFNVKRNSKAIVRSWRDRLTSTEINYIREATEDVSLWFYKNEDWNA